MSRQVGGKRSPKDILTLFGKILDEAAELYAVPKQEVNYVKWQYAAAGRLSQGSFGFLGSFGTLREYFAPSPNRAAQAEAGLAAIRRILEKTKKQA